MGAACLHKSLLLRPQPKISWWRLKLNTIIMPVWQSQPCGTAADRLQVSCLLMQNKTLELLHNKWAQALMTPLFPAVMAWAHTFRDIDRVGALCDAHTHGAGCVLRV